MEYIKVENGIITGHYAGDEPEEGCIPLKGEFWGAVGEPAVWYDENWNRIDDMTLYATGRRQLPEGMKINEEGTSLVEMDDDEKKLTGIKSLDPAEKIVDGKLEQKKQKELYHEGLITAEQYEQFKKMQRNSLLSSTDKFLLPDFPVSDEYREKIKAYRQQLRDITATAGWPDIELPKIPEEVL